MSVQETYINTHKIVSLGHSEYLAFPASIVNMRKGKKMTGMGFGAKPQWKKHNFTGIDLCPYPQNNNFLWNPLFQK